MAIAVGPEILPFGFPSEVKEGQLLQVSCIATTGDEPLSLTWYKDDEALSTSSLFTVNSMSRMSLLFLSDVNEQHSGSYSCLAVNPAGQTRATAVLRVQGVTKTLEDAKSKTIPPVVKRFY